MKIKIAILTLTVFPAIVMASSQEVFISELNDSIYYELPDIYCRWPQNYEKQQLDKNNESKEFKFISLFSLCTSLNLNFQKLQMLIHTGAIGFSQTPVTYSNQEFVDKSNQFIKGRKKKQGELAYIVTDDGITFIQEIPSMPIVRIQGMKVSGNRLLTVWLDVSSKLKDDKDAMRLLFKFVKSIQHSMKIVNS